jgi:AraC-like DNA-binding protein
MVMLFMEKRYLWYFPALLFLIPLVIPFKSELLIFPTEKKYRMWAYNDAPDSSGNSLSALSKVTNSSIIFNYTLRKFRRDPYAGFTIDPFDISSTVDISSMSNFSYDSICADSFIDISLYDSISVDIITEAASYFEIQLKTYIKNVTHKDDFRTCHTMVCQVPVTIGTLRYSIPKEKFFLPIWWYIETIKKFGDQARTLPTVPDYSKLFHINFESNIVNPQNVAGQFTITRIAFVKESKRSMINMICLICFASYIVLTILAFFIIRIIKGKRPDEIKKKQKINGYENISNDFPKHIPPGIIDMEFKQLDDYMRSHYQESDLTLEKFAQGAKVLPAARVTIILQKKRNMTYPQFLNDYRIKAAQNLLITTDLPINDIGYNVGYNHIPNFNRVFREIVGCSPGEYRDGQKESNNNT